MGKRLKYENLFLGAVRIGIFLALLTPLVMGRWGLTLSAFPKSVFFRSLIEIIFIFYLLLVFLNSKYLPKISSLFLAVSLFVGILLFTGIVGVNFHRSFWGDPERAEGIITHLHLFAFFFILTSVFFKKKEWLYLLKISVGVSALSSLAGLLQKTGAFSFYGVSLPGRISGTLSNPDFFGPYVVLTIFLTLLLLLIEKKKDMKIIWGSVLGVHVLALAWSGTRGAWIGMISASVLVLFLWVFRCPRFYPRARKAFLFGFLGFVVILLFFSLFSASLSKSENPFVARLASIFSVPLGSRAAVWNVALEAWQEKPLLGWGIESFSFVYGKYAGKGEFQVIPQSIYFDYPHNKVLETMVSAGLLGLSAYLFVFVAAFYLIFSSFRFDFEKPEAFLLFLPGFFTAYFVQNLLVFDTISSYILFFLVLALINNFSGETVKNNLKKPEKKTGIFLKSFFAIILVFCSLALFYCHNCKSVLAARLFPASFEYEKKEPLKAVLGYKKAVDIATVYKEDFRLILVERALLVLDESRVKDDEEKGKIIEIIRNQKSFLEKSLDAPNRRPLSVYKYLAKINEEIYLFSKKEQSLEEMEDILNRALSFNSQSPSFYYLMGELEILKGNYKKGEELFEKGFSFDVKNSKNRINLCRQTGAAYLRAENLKKAGEYFKKMADIMYCCQKDKPLPPESEKYKQEAALMDKAANLYCRELRDLDTCREIYDKAIEAYPRYKKLFQESLEKAEK